LLKIINTGLGRTGTTSLQAALERLGYGPCYHMFGIIGDEVRLKQWERIVCEGEQPDWKAVFDGYASIADGPASVYYRQVVEAFPDAKVVLTVRDGEDWYRSTHDTLYQFALRSKENPPPEGSPQARLYRVTSTLIWDGLFEGRFSDKEFAIEVFQKRNQEIIDSIAPGNLLVYDVREGWEPLCAFLGADVPAEEFPHANDTASMRERMGRVGGPGPVPAR